MSDEIAIKVDHVSKTFRLPHEKNNSIKGALINFRGKKKTFEKQKVLDDVSFEIKKGEFFGIVGRNGSGKSTLLKMLAGIYAPSKGSIQVKGKLTPFIELGVGFNPELTGRENVYLNGSLLGFSRKEMAAMYDDIVEFAELEKFMDQKLKNYSSGMQVRLAFSIAIRVKSDILLIDEVLAVGDEAFQKKCVKVFDEYKKNRQTVILVTHDMAAVKKYCSKAMLINDGEIIEYGSPHDVANNYSKLNMSNYADETGKKIKSNIQLKVQSKGAGITGAYEYGQSIEVALKWPETLNVDTAGIAIYSSTGEYVYGTNTKLDNITLGDSNKLVYSAKLDLGSGNYYLMAGVFKGENHDIVDFISSGPSFVIGDNKDIVGEGLVRLKHDWVLQ